MVFVASVGLSASVVGPWSTSGAVCPTSRSSASILRLEPTVANTLRFAPHKLDACNCVNVSHRPGLHTTDPLSHRPLSRASSPICRSTSHWAPCLPVEPHTMPAPSQPWLCPLPHYNSFSLCATPSTKVIASLVTAHALESIRV